MDNDISPLCSEMSERENKKLNFTSPSLIIGLGLNKRRQVQLLRKYVGFSPEIGKELSMSK